MDKNKNKNKIKNKKITNMDKMTAHLSCPLTWEEIEELKIEIDKMPAGTTIKCSFCERKSKLKYFGKCAFKYHLIKHTNETKFECDECGKPMKRQNSVNLHKRRNKDGLSNCKVIKERQKRLKERQKRLKKQGI